MFALGNIDTADISSKNSLKNIVQEYTRISNHTWYKFSNNVNITKCSKVQWTNEYSTKLNTYCSSKTLEDWKKFKGFVKQTKYSSFNKKIQEIVSKNKRLWNFMNWVKKCKLPTIEVLQHNGQPCIELEDLLQTLYQTFYSVQSHQVNLQLLDEILSKPPLEWPTFLKEEFKNTITKCNNLSTPGPDHVS